MCFYYQVFFSIQKSKVLEQNNLITCKWGFYMTIHNTSIYFKLYIKTIKLARTNSCRTGNKLDC